MRGACKCAQHAKLPSFDICTSHSHHTSSSKLKQEKQKQKIYTARLVPSMANCKKWRHLNFSDIIAFFPFLYFPMLPKRPKK